MLLASLPTSYENLVVALEARDELPKLSTLKIKLGEECDRRKVNNNSAQGDDDVQIFMAHTRRSNKGRNNDAGTSKQKNHRNFNCFNCGRSGHYAAQCRDRGAKGKSNGGERTSKREYNNNGNRRSGNNKGNVKCYNCGRRGHVAAQCREKGKTSEEKHTHSYAVLESSNKKSVLNSSVWCVDSGASSHMCGDRSLFKESAEHTEKIDLVGEKKIVARGKGSVWLADCDIMLNDVLYVPEMQCNFMSVGKIAEKATVRFENRGARILERGKTVMFARKQGNFFFTARRKSAIGAAMMRVRRGNPM
ncbi:uncharacterized protein [Musca autumnalis]|uniref:uncharacterized protein n=1 Tax=Musca autumnalis TaxID=221902 RepID=UPI003CF2730A